MQMAICLLAVIPMRKEPAHRSEMVSQVLFGEYVRTGEEKQDFTFITCDYDGYEGWVQTSQLTSIDQAIPYSTKLYTSSFSTPVIRNDSLLQVPYASLVYEQNGYSFHISGEKLNYLCLPEQIYNASATIFSTENLTSFYQPFINVPYLWGGRSVLGIDCSGFAQQVFKLFNVNIARDANQQAEQGDKICSIADAQCGDLGFFCNEHGRVTHVGIIL